VPYDLDPKWIGIVVSSSLILGLVVSALPAWRAMSNDPLECLRDK
jgi:ABC-type lipoprotein release transport system permease subunit